MKTTELFLESEFDQDFQSLAITLHLPRPYLKKLIANKEIPYLDAGHGRLRFCLPQVKAALCNIAERTVQKNPEQQSARANRFNESGAVQHEA